MIFYQKGLAAFWKELFILEAIYSEHHVRKCFLGDLLYNSVLSLGIWGEFRIAFCCSIGEKVEPQRVFRARAEDQKVPYLWGRCVPRENEKQEWVMWSRGKGYRERASFQPKRQNISLQPLDVCLSPIMQHSIIISEVSLGNLPPGYTLLNGIGGKLVTVAISCGHTTVFQTCTAYISTTPLTLSSTRSPSPSLLTSFNSHYSSCHHLLLHYPDCIRPSITLNMD